MTSMRTHLRYADGLHGWVRCGRLVGLFAALLLGAGLTAAPAGAVGSSDGGRLLDVTAHDGGLTAAPHDFYAPFNTQLKAGLVEVHLHNAGSVTHQVQLMRLHDGVTTAAYVLALVASQGGAALQLADASGGSNAVDPGGDQTTFVNLAAGDYVAMCFLSDGGDGAPHFAHGMLAPFTVEGQGTSAHPPARSLGSVGAYNFNYNMPAVVDGHGLYGFTNTSTTDTHELTIMRLAANSSAQSFLTWIRGGTGQPPVVSSNGGAGALAPGRTAYVQFELPPGNYVAVCFVPDDESPHPPHAVLGMVHGFSAT
jgi:hypothetical protein